MKEKALIAILLVIIMIVLVGCTNTGARATNITIYDLDYPVMSVCTEIDTRFFYAIDEKTNVVYLMFVSHENHNDATSGISVAYNADGTIMTKDQLERKTTKGE